MNITDLPNTSGSISNGLQLARQMARAIGQVQVYADSIEAIPPNRAPLIALFTAANAFLTALDLKVRTFTAMIADSTLTVAQVSAVTYSATLYNNSVVTTGRTVTLASSDPLVASVSALNVTGVGAGTATITVTDVASGRTVAIVVTVA
jgi:hypothetical protein